MQAVKNWCDGERVKKLGILMSSKQGVDFVQESSMVGVGHISQTINKWKHRLCFAVKFLKVQ
jgi:hypothetical protein